MTDTHDPYWANHPTTVLSAYISGRRCGWHVHLSRLGRTLSEHLRPTVLGKSCVPYRVDPNTETCLTEAQALAVGLANIVSGVGEECPHL